MYLSVLVRGEDGREERSEGATWVGTVTDSWDALPWIGGGSELWLNYTLSEPSAQVTSATLRASAAGCYSLRLNGADVRDEEGQLCP
jgi:hypothetical protein